MTTVKDTISFEDIIFGNRLRQDYPNVEELAESIHSQGIIHPICLSSTEGNGVVKNELIAGGRRYRAYTLLRKQYPGKYDEIPCTYREIKSREDLQLLELEENLRREDMTWQERTIGITNLHKLCCKTKKRSGVKWTQATTGKLLGVTQANVSYYLKAGEALIQGDEEIQKCTGVLEAVQKLLQRKAEEAQKLRLQRVKEQTKAQSVKTKAASKVEGGGADAPAKVSGGPSAPDVSVAETNQRDAQRLRSIQREEESRQSPEVFSQKFIRDIYRHGDTIEVMQEMIDNGVRIDHIITDPPYAIDMDNLDTNVNIDSVVDEHQVDANLDLLERFIDMSYALLPESGFLVMWCDVAHWEKLVKWGQQAGFRVCRWPLVWCKTSTVRNSAAQFNPGKATEFCIIMGKSGYSLLAKKRSNNFFTLPNRRLNSHPFAKPAEVWMELINLVTHEGQIVLDPFAGSGSSFVPLLESGRIPMGIESVESHILTGVAWLHEELNKPKAATLDSVLL